MHEWMEQSVEGAAPPQYAVDELGREPPVRGREGNLPEGVVEQILHESVSVVASHQDLQG